MSDEDKLLEKFYISANELLNADIPPIEWIVETLIPEVAIVIFAGMPGASKSFVALYMAVCCCKGIDVFGVLKVKKGKIVYIDEENGIRRVKRRLEQIRNGLGIDDNIDIIFVIEKNIKLDTPGQRKQALADVLEEHKPILVICDSVVRMMGGNENDATDVRKVYDWIKPLRCIYKCSWLLIHHLSKGGYDNIRGSGDFSGMADKTLLSAKNKDVFVLTDLKNRDNEVTKPIEYQIIDSSSNSVEFKVVSVGKSASVQLTVTERCDEDILAWVRDNKVQHFSTKDVHPKMIEKGHKNNAIYTSLNKLVASGKIVKKSKGVYEIKS